MDDPALVHTCLARESRYHDLREGKREQLQLMARQTARTSTSTLTHARDQYWGRPSSLPPPCAVRSGRQAGRQTQRHEPCRAAPHLPADQSHELTRHVAVAAHVFKPCANEEQMFV
jgi:hypothetical protein